MNSIPAARLSELALDRVDVGLFAVDRQSNVMLWNGFMQQRSGLASLEIIGRNIFDCFPDLPRVWLKKKFDSVFLLKSSAFTSWEHRPYLFRFEHDRPITGGIEWMQQDCTFVPLIEHGEVVAVCVMIVDVTDISIAWQERETAVAALREASIRDALTGLFNRRYVSEQLSIEFEQWKRYGQALSVVLFDIDHFKRVNDTFGHLTGDEVLKAIAQAAGTELRDSDVLGRFGGEEFIAILPHCTVDGAETVGEKIRANIERQILTFSDSTLTATVSVGVACTGESALSPDILVGQADAALYMAKTSGRNRVCVWQ